MHSVYDILFPHRNSGIAIVYYIYCAQLFSERSGDLGK